MIDARHDAARTGIDDAVDSFDFPDVAATDDERLRAKAIRIRAAMADTPRSIAAGLIAGVALAACFSSFAVDPMGRIVPWIWWTVLATESLRVIWLTRRFNSQHRSAEEAFALSRHLAPSGIFAGAVWGCCAWFMFPASTPRMEAIAVVTEALVMMGAVSSKGLYRPTALQFMIPASVTFTLGLVRLGDGVHLFFAGGFVLFTIALLSFSKIQDRTLDVAILLRFRTEALLRERTVQQRETEAARHEAVRAREVADMANQAKTTFLASAGHDLRQPMHALVLYFGQLERKLREPEVADIMVHMGKSLESMQSLLDSLLEVSKLMTGSVRPEWSSFALAEVLDRIEAQMKPVAHARGLAFVRAGSTTAVIRSDPVILERILRNLVLNAIRYTEEGRVIVRVKRRDTRLVLQVFDSGIGIPRSERAVIFEAFYQIANQARHREKGLGIGLSIVRDLSRLLGIEVSVRSRLGRGSMFQLTLPAAIDTTANVVAPPSHVGVNYARGAFVVLIDDNITSLDATAASLRSFGCEVLAAQSSAQAINRLRSLVAMPQLILSDYRLEDETGVDAVAQVIDHQRRLHGDEWKIAALIVSGDTAPEEMDRVREAGYPMLHKPVRLNELFEAVNERLAWLASLDPLDDVGVGSDRSPALPVGDMQSTASA